MRGFNPFAIWSVVPLASRTASVIRSIQRGTITIALDSASNTGTLATTLTSTGKASLSLLGFSGGQVTGSANGIYQSMVRIDITNTTTITATREVGADGDQSLTVQYEVVEFY